MRKIRRTSRCPAAATGHTEAVQIVYDPARIDYAKLLDIFWRNIDPTVRNRQFCDVGSQYRSGIFYHSEEQRLLALKSKEALEKIQILQGADRHRGHRGGRILSGGGVPPAIL